MRKARLDSFRKYTVVAENRVAVKSQDAFLAQSKSRRQKQ